MKPFVGQWSIRGIELDHYTENAICPRCGSDIRHRFITEFIVTRTDLLKKRQRVLHFAPEISLYKLLSNSALDYVAADLVPRNFVGTVVEADITRIPYGEEFDYVICVHVLEHIEDDKQAISEIHRVLRPGGKAILAIPTYGELTYEDRSLDFNGRQIQYGIGDHLRLNGLDFQRKLIQAGFTVTVVSYLELPGNFVDRSVTSPHTESDKYLFFCEKPKGPAESQPEWATE